MINQFILKFKDVETEDAFNTWYLDSELKVLRYSLLLGIVTFFAFIPLDNILYSDDTARQFLILRVSIALIVAISYGLTFVLIRNYRQYQTFAIVIAIICFGANVVFTFFDNVDDFYFYTGNSVLIIFVFILLNIRFRYLMGIAILYISVHLIVLYFNFSYSVESFAHQGYGILSVVAISLISSRIIEMQKRKDFLNQKLIKEQKRELEANIHEKDLLLNELQEKNIELDAFNYSVSHDLKTPLRNVSSFSKLLERKYKGQLDETGEEYLKFIIDGTSKMNVLIEDLLKYARIRHTEINIELVDMNMLVEGLFTEQARSLINKPELHKVLLPSAKGDVILLRQVWANLLSNAIKYSSKKEKSVIRIGANKNRKEITYWINDNGIGFDVKFVSRLFTLFSRLHSDKEFSGTGVGLSLVDRIVKKHGGRIWAESEPEVGSTFFFTLPVKEL